MAADRLGPGRSRGTSSTESDDRAGRVTVAQYLECTPSRGAAVDDDRIERIARGGFERRLPAGLDCDQIEQGAEHTFDLGQPGRTTAGSGLIEGEGKCLGSGNPSVVFGLGVGLLGLPVRSIVLSDELRGLRSLQRRHQRLFFVMQRGDLGSLLRSSRFEVLTLLLEFVELQLEALGLSIAALDRCSECTEFASDL